MQTLDQMTGDVTVIGDQRSLDISIAKRARAAIWRVFDKPDKDATTVRWMRMGSQIRIDLSDIQRGYAGQGDYTLQIPSGFKIE
jgi:hypothetical protein